MPGKSNKIPRVCEVCQSSFEVWPFRANTRFCSHACYHQSRLIDPVIRFWSHVDRRDVDDCWLWTGGKQTSGYGNFGIEHSKSVGAHRFSYELAEGEIPAGLSVLHSCDTKLCVNPRHLRAGTQQENLRDMVERGRSTAGDKNPSRLYPERRARGERHGQAKLTVQEVQALRETYNEGGWTFKRLSEKFGISPSVARNIVRGKLWATL